MGRNGVIGAGAKCIDRSDCRGAIDIKGRTDSGIGEEASDEANGAARRGRSAIAGSGDGGDRRFGDAAVGSDPQSTGSGPKSAGAGG